MHSQSSQPRATIFLIFFAKLKVPDPCKKTCIDSHTNTKSHRKGKDLTPVLSITRPSFLKTCQGVANHFFLDLSKKKEILASVTIILLCQNNKILNNKFSLLLA